MKNRITILTGAGLTAGSDFFGITTQGVTQAFLDYMHPDLSDANDTVKFIYGEYCFWNKMDRTNVRQNLGQINFETILQIIEELFSYIEDIDRTNHQSKYHNSIKNTVYSLNRHLAAHIMRVRTPKYKDSTYIFIEKLYNHLIDLIVSTVSTVNDSPDNAGMTEFAAFLDRELGAATTKKRIYTLNYDSWLNKYRDYFDGFKGDTFDSSGTMYDRGIDCHFNLHGCVLWDSFQPKKHKVPQDRKHSQSFTGYTISREALLPSPIISGYNKLTRINSSPYLEIFHSLASDIVKADKIIAIGYSFADVHVNNYLRLRARDVKVVIVVYHPASELSSDNSPLNLLLELVSDLFKEQFTKKQIRVGLNHTIDSDSGKVSVFIDGIGQSFYGEFPNI